ncbi:MAG: hypothetical protein NC311_06695 [Muribaculaceae bacterium]|nr:hypothetical protein [Muribaculaceae bacterium]
MNPKTNEPVITTEDRAARIFEAFCAEHDVPQELHEDLMEEIILAINCYSDDDGSNGPVRQSELYDYMESYLVRWVGDLMDSRLPTIADVIHWGYWPESFAREVRHYGDSTSALVRIHICVGQ